MNQTFEKQSKFELLFELMEYHKIFVSPLLTPRKLAAILKISLNEAEALLFNRLGLSLKELILLYREQYSRDLRLKGVDSGQILQF